MKDNWLKDIHERMADYETDEPRGLWEDICRPTGPTDPPPTPHQKGGERSPLDMTDQLTEYLLPNLPGRAWGWVSAACLLLCWYVVKERPSDLPPSVPSTPTIAQTVADGHKATVAQADTDAEKTQDVVNTPKSQDNPPIAVLTYTNPNNTNPNNANHHNDNTTEAPETSPSNNNAASHPQTTTERQATYKTQQYEHKIGTGVTSRSRVAIALVHSEGANNDYRQTYHTGYLDEATTVNDGGTRWMDSPLLGIMALNRGVETERRVKHRAPIRTGLSVAYRLNDRWSLESGLTYATLASDSQEGSTANYLHGHQRLHYVGIPLGASFRAFSWKRLDLYLSANALGEKCIKGTQDMKFVIADEVLSNTSETIQEHPLQWSVGVKVGAQYNITPVFSLYAEPACNYYFNDGTSLETIYKDHPTQVSLNVGLRFSLGKVMTPIRK